MGLFKKNNIFQIALTNIVAVDICKNRKKQQGNNESLLIAILNCGKFYNCWLSQDIFNRNRMIIIKKIDQAV